MPRRKNIPFGHRFYLQFINGLFRLWYNLLWKGGGDNATVAVHINRLREKLEENPSKPRYIETVWGDGYRFRR